MEVCEIGMECSKHGKKRNAYTILLGNQKERVQQKDLNMGRNININGS